MDCKADQYNKTSTLRGIFIVTEQLEGGLPKLKRKLLHLGWGSPTLTGLQSKFPMSQD